MLNQESENISNHALDSEGNTMEIKLMTGHFMSILCTNKTKIKLQLYSVNLLQTNEFRNGVKEET
jgi:hypothetical protein